MDAASIRRFDAVFNPGARTVRRYAIICAVAGESMSGLRSLFSGYVARSRDIPTVNV